jgi:2-keto-4-pentenoate hydratase
LNARPLPDFPGRLPDTLEQAYAIQSASIGRWPDEVAGWKVAMMPLADRERFSVQRLAGPVFRSSIHKAETDLRHVVPVYEGGFAAIEAEFVLQLGTTVRPATRGYSDEELIEVLSEACCGAEIASSPMAVVNERGATSIISDFGNNAGVLVGPEIQDWAPRPLDSLPATVSVDDVVVGDATAAAVPGGPLQAFRFLVNHCAARGIELPAGTVVSTGAVTGVHDVQIDSIARVDYGPFGWFEVAFEPMSLRQ